MTDEHEQIPWHHLTPEQTAEKLGVEPKKGLSDAQAGERQTKYGKNRLAQAKRKSELKRFFLQFHQPLLYILLAASGITFYLGELVDSFVIFGVVFINAVVGYLQESKAEKAIEALSKMVVTEATVLRGGEKKRLASEELVPGDIVFLQSGDKVPADIRLFAVRSLQIDESALTGESVPVEKSTDALDSDTELADRANMAYAGTLVTYGQAEGIVCLTAGQTEIGRIAQLTSETMDLSTPLTKKIARFSKLLLFVIIGLAVVAFIVGVARGNSTLEMFMASVALAVGAIPEGLPAAVTITMAIGVSRMARRKAIIRKLPAVEALGSTTVICSDKTGTLTENEMTVEQVYAGQKIYEVTGSGYHPQGEFHPSSGTPELTDCLRAGLLCNDSRLVEEGGRFMIKGDPTEGALIVCAHKAGLAEESSRWPRLDEIPFESEYQYMATLHRDPGGQSAVIYAKGAVERIVEKCKDIDHEAIKKVTAEMAKEGLRVLAFAKKPHSADRITHDDIAQGLTFLGLQGMMDPPRQEAVESVRRCQEAGIRVKMITGDHVLTAAAIAAKVGLQGAQGQAPESFAIAGRDLERMSDEEFSRAANRTVVFARVVPEQKLRLVKALQAHGHIVAMTGDGVNDAPALKQADIGIAMGITGTDVAKGAAHMLLTDDNFSSIEAAVEEGRGVFDNLTKFIVWTLPTNVGEALIVLVAIFTGMSLPIVPVQLLWINLMTAIFLGLMLVFEPKEKDLMQRPPRNPKQQILTLDLIMRTGLVTLVMLAGAYWLFIHSVRNEEVALAHARTCVVNVIVMVEVAYLFNCRSLTRSIFKTAPFSNLWVIGGSLIMIGAQLVFTYSPLMNHLFDSAPLRGTDWMRIGLAALIVFLIVEVEKWVRERFKGSGQRSA